VRLIRSWPFSVPPGRAHVDDSIERLVIDNYGYQPLNRIDDDVLLLEWDIAVERGELRTFARLARETPDSVIVAPYRLYYPELPQPVWAHRKWDGNPPGANHPEGARHVLSGDPFCNLFGLGMIYLPRKIVRAFFEARYSTHVGDVEFSMWHYRNVSQRVPIAWNVRPVHLNYKIEGTEWQSTNS